MSVEIDEPNADWCPVEEKVTLYDGDTCTSCGRVWGVDY